MEPFEFSVVCGIVALKRFENKIFGPVERKGLIRHAGAKRLEFLHFLHLLHTYTNLLGGPFYRGSESYSPGVT
jgi:hypothetical protein